MKAKHTKVDHLQENIAMLRDLDKEYRRYAIRAFHKAGHVIIYHHFNMGHGCVSIVDDDSIEDDLSYMSLHNTNYPEHYVRIALGGVMMEQLITNACPSTDEDIEKAILLIRIQNRLNQRLNTEDDDRSFVIATSQVATILLQYQREAGLLYRELFTKRTVSYAQACRLLNKQ